MKIISLLALLFISFPQAVFSMESQLQHEGERKLPRGVEMTRSLILNTDRGIIDKTENLKQEIIEIAKSDQFSTITIVGKKFQLGYTLQNIADLKLLNLRVLDLDIFYTGEDINMHKADLNNIFKEQKGLKIIMSMNDKVLDVFRIGENRAYNNQAANNWFCNLF